MGEKLREWIGRNVQVTTAVDVTKGVLVSVDSACLTVRTSGLSGYENGTYAIVPFRSVSYVRLV